MNESEYGKYVALDVEMTPVIAPGSAPSEPTQVAITDINGNVLFNEYFQLTHPPRVTMSKARSKKLRENARRKYNEDAKNAVLSVLRGKIVVGHDLTHDFRALGIDPDRDDNGIVRVIDSATLDIFKRINPVTFQKRSLQNLTQEFLHRSIQGDVMHNAVEDSKASANLIRTTFPYLNAPLPVTPEMVAKAKVVANYGRRMGLNTEAAPAPAAAVPPNAAVVNNMPNLLQFEQPVKSAENYLKEMEGLNMRKTETVKTANNYLREIEGLNTHKPVKTANNYLREMKGLMNKNHFAELVNEHQGRNSRKRVNRRKRKTRRLRR